MRVSRISAFALSTFYKTRGEDNSRRPMLAQIAPMLSRHLGFILAGWPVRYVVFPVFQTGRGPWGGYVYLPMWRQHGVQIGETVLSVAHKKTIIAHWMTYPSDWITFRDHPSKGGLTVLSAIQFLRASSPKSLLRDYVVPAGTFRLPATNEDLYDFVYGR